MIHDVNTDIDDFVRLVHADCPGGLDSLKKRAVIQAMIEFFKKTYAWREFVEQSAYVDYFNPEFDVSTVIRTVVPGAAVVSVDDVWLSSDTQRLKKLARAEMDKNNPDWRKNTADKPRGYFFGPGKRLRVYPVPKKDAGFIDLDIEFVLLPTMDMTRFPDFVYEMYGEIIAAGAAQRLKSQPSMPWTDPQQAQFFFKKFDNGVREARHDQARQVARAINEKRRRSFR